MLKRLAVTALLLLVANAVQALAADSAFPTIKGDRLVQSFAVPLPPCDPLRFNCEPFKPTQVQPAPAPTTTAPAPVPNVEIKNLTLPPLPQQGESWISWLYAALSSLGLLWFGKLGNDIKNRIGTPQGTAPLAVGDPDRHGVQEVISAMLHPEGPEAGVSLIKNPNVRLMALQTLSRVVQSGIPGQLIQSGASLIPGVGPIASMGEPALRRLAQTLIDERAEQFRNQTRQDAPRQGQDPAR